MHIKTYTLTIHAKDKRFKSGKRLIGTYDYPDTTENFMKGEVRDLKWKLYSGNKFEIDFCETYVERTNISNGKKYLERFDTPICCSPSSETYWSM
jgi:hypothetical protein